MPDIGAIARMFAHDVKNHLATIKMNVDMLDEGLDGVDLPDREAYQRKLERIRTSLHLITDTVQDFLRLANPLTPEPVPIDINVLIREIADFIEPECYASRIELSCSYGDDLPRIQADKRQLTSVLLNLIINAREAIDTDGQIDIVTQGEEDGGISIQIKDDGGGMPPETEAKVFSAAFSTKEHGTGLGLMIAGQTAAALGASLAFENNPGTGMVFTLKIPAGQNETDNKDS